MTGAAGGIRPPPNHTDMRRAAGATILLLSAALLACGGPIRPEELARSVDSLSSTAGEGALLAREVARDHSKDTFVRAHARELADSADHEAEKLSDATASDGIAGEKAAAVRLAGDISQALGELQTQPDNALSARKVARELEALQRGSDRLSQSL
jgi:hypothetical protein